MDLEYPEELHDLHNDYPLAPSKVNTSDLVLSDYCNKIINKLELKRGNYEKLTPTLHNETKYVMASYTTYYPPVVFCRSLE